MTLQSNNGPAPIIRGDILEPTPTVPPLGIDLGQTNSLLFRILGELRKDNPKQRCIIQAQGGTVLGGVYTVATGLPPVQVSFLNEGNPIKSFYTVIVNGSDALASISINEPNISILQGANLVGNGIVLPAPTAAAKNFIVLPDVEIQYLSINSFGANAIPVNGTPTTHGAIWVYAWTLPEYANITE